MGGARHNLAAEVDILEGEHRTAEEAAHHMAAEVEDIDHKAVAGNLLSSAHVIQLHHNQLTTLRRRRTILRLTVRRLISHLVCSAISMEV